MYKKYTYELFGFYRVGQTDASYGIFDSKNDAVNKIKEMIFMYNLDFKTFTKRVCKAGKVKSRTYYFNPDLNGICYMIEQREVK